MCLLSDHSPPKEHTRAQGIWEHIVCFRSVCLAVCLSLHLKCILWPGRSPLGKASESLGQCWTPFSGLRKDLCSASTFPFPSSPRLSPALRITGHITLTLTQVPASGPRTNSTPNTSWHLLCRNKKRSKHTVQSQ